MFNLKTSTALVLMMTALSTSAFANTPPTAPTTGYWALGGLQLDTDPTSIDGLTMQTKNGFAFGAGSIKPLPYANSYWDWSVLIGGNEETLTSTQCVTDNGNIIDCDYSVTTVVATVPVTANVFYPITNKLKVSAGLGGSIALLYYDAALEASGYKSKGTDTTSAFSISPMLQAAITYDHVQLKFSHVMNIGNSETGKGDVSFITLNWLTNP